MMMYQYPPPIMMCSDDDDDGNGDSSDGDNDSSGNNNNDNDGGNYNNSNNINTPITIVHEFPDDYYTIIDRINYHNPNSSKTSNNNQVSVVLWCGAMFVYLCVVGEPRITIDQFLTT